MIAAAGCGGGGEDVTGKAPDPVPAPVAPALSAGITGFVSCESIIYSRSDNYDESDVEKCRQIGAYSPDNGVIFDIVAFDEGGNSLEVSTVDGFAEEAGSLGIDNAYFFKNAKKLTQQSKGPYSVVLAFDQSGSISTTDSSNLRIDAGNVFIEKNSAPDEMALGYFQDSNFRYVIPRIQGGFFSYTPVADGFGSALSQFKGSIGGGTPLFDAIAAATQLAVDKGRNSNKAVVVFSDGKDTTSAKMKTAEEAIQYASSRSVPIYTFALDGGDQDLPTLQNISNRTKGAFLYASNARQLVSMYGSLGNLLRGRAGIYRTYWNINVTPSSAPSCFLNRPTKPGIYGCNVPANLKIKTNKGDIRLRANYVYSYRVA